MKIPRFFLISAAANAETQFTSLLGDAQNAFEAELRCRKLGGHLPFFDNDQEWRDYLAAVGDFSGGNWIGAHRVGQSDIFVNVDGSDAYLPWTDGEPNNSSSDENCVERNGEGVKDQSCDSEGRQFSCRIDTSPRCTDIATHCPAYVCGTDFGDKFCPVSCGTCGAWLPEEIGDISFLDNWESGNCVDLATAEHECSLWATYNQCMINPESMLKNCPVSCKQCEPMIIPSPPKHWSVCHDYLIGPHSWHAITSSEVGNTTEFSPSCDVLEAEKYRIKAQIECNFDKISASTKTAHILSITNSFRIRTGHDSTGHYYQVLLDTPLHGVNEIISFGGDIREGESLFFHEGDCSEGEFVEFVVDQWTGDNGKTHRQLSIAGFLSSHLSSDQDLQTQQLDYKMGHTENHDLYVYSDIKVKALSVETFRALPDPAIFWANFANFYTRTKSQMKAGGRPWKTPKFTWLYNRIINNNIEAQSQLEGNCTWAIETGNQHPSYEPVTVESFNPDFDRCINLMNMADLGLDYIDSYVCMTGHAKPRGTLRRWKQWMTGIRKLGEFFCPENEE